VTKQNSCKFGLVRVEAVKAKQHEFFELEIHGVKQLSIFEAELEAKYQGEFRAILTYMDYCSNGNLVPVAKMKDITPHKDPVKEFEFKSKHLRIYAIQQSCGKIVVFCGFKNTQPEDIRQFRSIKEQYLLQVNKEHNGKK
jgi:putative component of toxin-antitoxin plasmid stabilization module